MPNQPLCSSVFSFGETCLPSPLQRFQPDWAGAEQVELWIKRDDLIHPIVSGNKWRKLSAVLGSYADRTGALPAHIISFGGGFSNHLHALGFLCHTADIRFTAIVRGHYQHNPTPMLRDLMQWGTDLSYVNKTDYRQRSEAPYLAALQQRYPEALVIPEGGSAQEALTGMGQLVEEIRGGLATFDHIACPVASGATLAGIAAALQGREQALGIAVLKGQEYLETLVENLSPHAPANWHIDHAHCGQGYAKTSPELTQFCSDLQCQYALAVEPVYSGKLFMGIRKKLAAGDFTPGSRIVLVHTGGLQGARR